MLQDGNRNFCGVLFACALCHSKLTDLEVDSRTFAERYTLASKQCAQALKAFRNAADGSCIIQQEKGGHGTTFGHGVRCGEADLVSTSHTFPTEAAVGTANLVFPGHTTICGQPDTKRNARCLRPQHESAHDTVFTGQQSSVPDMSIVFEPRLKDSETAHVPSFTAGTASLDVHQCNLFVIHQEDPSNPSKDGWLVSGIVVTDRTETYLRLCEGDLYFGDSGAAVVALGVGRNSEYEPACVGIVVGGHQSRPDFWLLKYDTIMAVLDIVRFMSGMTLAEPNAELAREAEKTYALCCTPLPEKQQIALNPYRCPDPGQMDKKIVTFTDVMISEFNKSSVPRQSAGEKVLFVGNRPAVIAAAESYSKDSKVQDMIKRTARFDHGPGEGEIGYVQLQVSGLLPNQSGSKKDRARKLNAKADNVWTRCIVPFNSDTAISREAGGQLIRQDIVAHCTSQLSKNRWLPELAERPKVESLDEHRQMVQTAQESELRTAKKCRQAQKGKTAPKGKHV